MAELVTDNVYRMRVRKKKSKAGIFGRALASIAGLFFVLLGIILCVTIIGIIPGWGSILIGVDFSQ